MNTGRLANLLADMWYEAKETACFSHSEPEQIHGCDCRTTIRIEIVDHDLCRIRFGAQDRD